MCTRMFLLTKNFTLFLISTVPVVNLNAPGLKCFICQFFIPKIDVPVHLQTVDFIKRTKKFLTGDKIPGDTLKRCLFF